MKKGLILILCLILTVGLVACSSDQKEQETTTQGEVIKVGATPVPHAQILEVVKDDLKTQGITLEIVEFTDYVIPNTALEEGEIFANFFQHVPYLESFNKDHGTHLVSIGGIHVEPLGIYSEKVDSLDAIAEGAKIAVPNDPSNEARALILLEEKGLIKLKDKTNLKSTTLDISENPKNLEFEEVEAALLPRILDDVDAAVINTNYVLEAEIDPKTALTQEGAESPYANVLVVREADKDSEAAKKLLEALQSEKVKKYIEEEFQGAVVPAF